MSNKVKLTELGDAGHKVDSSATIDTTVGGSATKSAAKVKLTEMHVPQTADATSEDRERLNTQMSLGNMTRGFLGDELEDTRQSIEDYNPQMYAQQRRMAAYDQLESGEETRSRITDIYRDVEDHNPAESYIGKKHKVANAMVSSLPRAEEGSTDVMLGNTRYTRDEAYDAMVGMVENTMHNQLFGADPRYRSDYFIKNYGTTIAGYLQQLDDTLSELQGILDSEAGREIGALIDAQTHPDAFVGRYLGALAGKEAHGAGMIREARDHIRSIASNNFATGFAEAFDWTTTLTAGLNELASGVVLNNVLDKALKGERLTAREEVAYKAYQVSSEIEQLHEAIGGRSKWNMIGMGVGESAELAPQFLAAMATGGAAAGALGVGMRNLPIRAAGKVTLNAFRQGVLNGIKTGVLNTGRLIGTSAGNMLKAEAIGLASSLIMPSTWGNFMDKRNGQFSMVDGKLTFTPSSAWKDAVDAWIEGGGEVAGEVLGARISSLLGGSARMFGRLIGVERIARKMGIGKASRTLFGYRKPAFIRRMERNVGFSGFVSEPVSEVWGDASANLLKGMITGREDWEQMSSSDYWTTVLGTCAIYGGALTMATSALPMSRRYAQIHTYGKQRKEHLEQIADAELYNAVVEALATDDIDAMAQKLASIDWANGNYNRIEIGHAMDALRAEYAQRVAIGAEEETARMNEFVGVANRVSSLAYRGKDGDTLEDYILRVTDKDGVAYVAISGDASSEFYVCYDANFNKVSIPVANVVETSTISVGEEMANEYDTLFSMEGEIQRQNNLIESYESLRDVKGVGEKIKGLAQLFGVPIRQSGDSVALADGTTHGVVYDYVEDRGEYIVATEDGGMVTVPFYDVLSENEDVAEAQTLSYAQRKQTQVEEAIDTEEQSVADGNVVTTPTNTRYRVGDLVYTPTGAQVRVREVNADGTYEVDYNTAESVAPADMELESFNEADLRSDAAETVEGMPMQEVNVSSTEEVITTEGVAPTAEEITHDEITPVPMNEDGTINYDAIEDPKQYATLYTQEVGDAQTARDEVRDMRSAIEEDIEKSMAKWKKAKSANEKMQNRRERDALAARMAFYDNVLNILEAQVSPQAEVVEETETPSNTRMSLNEAEGMPEEATSSAEHTTPVQHEVGLVQNKFAKRLRDKYATTIDALAKAFGLVVEFVDEVHDAESGARANADISGNVVRIAWAKRTRAISFLIGHEFTHRMQDLSKVAYASFKEAVIKFLGEDVWNARVDAMQKLYEAKGIAHTREKMEDEVVADFVGYLVRDKHAFETFLENKSKGFIQRVIDVFESIIAYISSRVAHNKAMKSVIASLHDLAAVAAETVEKGGKTEDEKSRFSLQNNVPAEELAEIEAERKAIIETAKANGTYLKAPNGKDTNLTPEQWVDVRTSRFKKWFGDWEKVARIEKLRSSESVSINGNEITPSDDIKEYRKNALEYGKTIRGEYKNADTGATIVINKDSLTEVLHHDGSNVAHIQSIAAIPQMVESGIYITSEPVSENASKKLRNAKMAHYYVCGLNIGGIPYTVKFVVAEFESGEKYYDHSLTEIEKGELLNRAELSSTVAESKTPISDIKDKRLVSILQINSSKIVDENGEPKVVYHGDRKKARYIFSTDTFFTPKAEYAKRYTNGTGEVYATFLDIKRPFDIRDKKAYNIFTEFRGGRKPVATTTGAMDWGEYSYEDLQEYVEDVAPNEYDGFILDEGADPDGNGGVIHRGLSFVPFAPNQIKSATDNVGTYNANNPDIRYSLITPDMDAAYMDAVNNGDMETAQRMVMEAAEKAGYTIRGEHGTTHKFTIFNYDFANKENSFGVGHYFTSDYDDAVDNHSTNEGPDLKNRIQLLAERMEYDPEYEDMTDEERLDIATQKLSGGENVVISAALRMDNPVVFGVDADGDIRETYFDFTYDEEADEYEEPEGLLIDFVDALNTELSSGDYWGTKSVGLWELTEDDGIYANELRDKVIDLLFDTEDNDGNMVSHNIFRNALVRMGFDGIIDNEPSIRFSNMGLSRYTKHYIVFESNQIKLTDPVTFDDNGNVIPLSERFNPKKEDIRYSIQETNDRFNAELDAFKAGTHKGLLHLGYPSEILKVCGVGARELTISPRELSRHLKKHNLTTDDLKDLVYAIQEPIMVYKHGKKHPNIVVITEVMVNNGKLSVSIELDDEGNVVEISNISSVHSKDALTELDRLSELSDEELKKALKWVDKEKVSGWLMPTPYMESGASLDPKHLSVTNIIQNFENPKVLPRFSLMGEMGAANLDAYDEVTTRLDNLEVARDMEAMGRDAMAIKYATGWERGADGLWRYEEDDEITSYTISRLKTERDDILAERAARIAELKERGDSALLATYNALPEEYFLLEEVLGEDHPIFAAYPTFRNMRVILAPYRYQSYEGYYGNGTNTILIVDKSGNDLRKASVLAHEIQHAIQHKEGFERGTNLEKTGSIDEYNRHAGEVEARNVQTRLLYTPGQRRATLAAATEDVAREDQIMLRKGLAEDGAARQSIYDAPFFNDEDGDVIYFEDSEIEYPAVEVRPRTTEDMIKLYMKKRHLAANERIRKETRDIIAVTRKLYKERDAERRKTIQSQRTNAAKVDLILGDINRESISLFDQALIAIAEGMVHIRWDSDGARKGIAAELGLKEGERKYYSSITKNATQSFEGCVHELWESMNGYERDIDIQDLRNALIEALGEASTATRAIEMLRDKYDTALRERDEAIAQAEAQRDILLAEEKARYDGEVSEFENSEDKSSIIRYYEQGQLLNEDMAIAHGALRDMERELKSIRNQLDNRFYRRQTSLVKMREGIEAAKAAVIKAIEGTAVLKFNRQEVASLIDKLKDARSLNDVEFIRKRVEGMLQNFMLRQANNDIHRLLQLRLPNGELAETWIGEQIVNGVITAADGKRILADLWRGHNNKGVSVAKYIHGDTADAMVMLRKMVEEYSKRDVLERKEVTGEDGKTRTVVAKFGDDKELTFDVEGIRAANESRIANLEQKMREDMELEEGKRKMTTNEKVEYEARLLYAKYIDVIEAKQHVNNIRKDIDEIRNNDNIEEARKREIINSLYKALPRAKAAYLKTMQDFSAEVSSYMAEGRDKLKAFREGKERHRNEILALGRNAVGDVKATDNPPTAWEKVKAFARNTISDPDYTYMTMLRVIDHKAPNGEGKFYEHFAYEAQHASDNFFNAQYVHYSRLKDAIARFFPELKGMNPFKAFTEIMNRTDEIAIGTIEYAKAVVNGKIKERTSLPLNLSNAMYIVAMWDQPRYQIGMTKHGITADKIREIKNAIPEEYLGFMEWVRDTFLPDTRKEYDEVHRRMFGISMDEEVSYFPARIMGYIQQVDISESEKTPNAKPSVTTGAIVSRKEHGLMPNVGMGYFQMLQAHIQNMDKWAAYAELNEELNTLASDNIFKSRLETMMPGDGRGRSGKGSLYDIFVSRCAIMAQCFNYAPTSIDAIALWFQKNWATSNITHRYFTALKQLSGLAVYAVKPKDLTRQLVRCAKNPAKYLREVSELSPSFRQRWESRIAGSEILNKEPNANGFADLNRSKRSSMARGMSSLWSAINTIAVEWGMAPNAAVDAVVSAIGFMTLYEGSLNDMRKAGKEVTAADKKKAILEAEMRFNETQQSNEGAYLSRLQRQRSFLLAGQTTYANATFGLHRLRKEGLREIFKKRTPEEIAEIEAEYGEGAIKRGKKKAWEKLMMGIFGEAAFIGMKYGLPALFAMLGGGEDDDDTPWWEDILHFLGEVTLQTTFGGYIGGGLITGLYNGYDYDLTPSWTDFIRDLSKIWDINGDDTLNDIFSWDRFSVYSTARFLGRYGIGIDIKTFANIVKGIEGTVEGMIYGDGTAEAILMFLNAPKSNINAIAGRVREGETLQEYITRRLRLESLIFFSDYADYFDVKGRYIGDKTNNDFMMAAYTARNLVKDYNTSYQRSVIRREGGVSTLRDILNTDAEYASKAKKIGWTPEARPNKKALEGGSYVAPIPHLEYKEYEQLSNIQTYIAEMSDQIERFVGADEVYYTMVMQRNEAKKNLIKYYDEFIK